MPNEIIRALQRDGSYTLSRGTMEPATVFSRLLVAVETLDPAAHEQLLRATSACVPDDASKNEHHSWWGSEEAAELVESVMRTIQRAVLPHGACVTFAGVDCFELASLDAPDTSDVSFQTLITSRPPPSASAIRRRVR